MEHLALTDRQFAEQYFSNFVDNPKHASNFTENLAWYDEMYSDSDFDTTEFNRDAGLSTLGIFDRPVNNYLSSGCGSYKDIWYSGFMGIEKMDKFNRNLILVFLAIIVLFYFIEIRKKTA
jgi:hypothetical protein